MPTTDPTAPAVTQFFDDSGDAPRLVATVNDPTGRIKVPLSVRLFDGHIGPVPKRVAWVVGLTALAWWLWKRHTKKKARGGGTRRRRKG